MGSTGSTLGEVSGLSRKGTVGTRRLGAEAEHVAASPALGGQPVKAAFIFPGKAQFSLSPRPLPAPSSALLSCLPIQGHDLFSDKNVRPPHCLWPPARAMHWPHEEKGGQKESSLAERMQALGEGSRSGLPLTFCLFSQTAAKGVGGPRFLISSHS